MNDTQFTMEQFLLSLLAIAFLFALGAHLEYVFNLY